jgi:protein-S-isoprenylcysteine O-methyltransferase Ste14
MEIVINHPILVFLLTFVLLLASSNVGKALRSRQGDLNDEEHDDLGMILGSTLTLLGLIIGFSFSMAISRYDQRKNYEEAEANAIGTEYVRADLLPAATAEKVRGLLRSYVAERVLFYKARGREELQRVNERTAQLQADLWKAVAEQANGDQSAMKTLAVAGMNDVLNSQGYTQAAWWNRIPTAAWGLMWVIAIFCNTMLGYYVQPTNKHWVRLTVMPLIVAVSFLLIADIDSPRWGIIRVVPQNLVSLQQGLK